jgi:hypothetical protein
LNRIPRPIGIDGIRGAAVDIGVGNIQFIERADSAPTHVGIQARGELIKGKNLGSGEGGSVRVDPRVCEDNGCLECRCQARRDPREKEGKQAGFTFHDFEPIISANDAIITIITMYISPRANPYGHGQKG